MFGRPALAGLAQCANFTLSIHKNQRLRGSTEHPKDARSNLLIIRVSDICSVAFRQSRNVQQLFLTFLMRRASFAPFAILAQFKFHLDKFLTILGRVVVNPFALGAGQFYEVVLGHKLVSRK